jgi:hypothetical protein
MIHSAAKAGIDFAALMARLKPRPFKTKSKPEFRRKLCKAAPFQNRALAEFSQRSR